MSSPLAFSPEQLDRLEDALEDLELDAALLDGDGDDPVVQRLADYRELLQLSRQALPLEDVPAGVLDGVLAQARQAASTAAAAPEPERRSFWARWRLGVWVPALAFAGSAALLLVVLVPKDEPGRGEAAAVARSAADEPAAKEKAEAKAEEDGRLAFGELSRQEQAEGDGALRGQGLAIGERAPEPAAADPAVPPEEAEEQPAADDEAAMPDRARRKATSTPKAVDPAKPKPNKKSPAGSSGGVGAGKGGAMPGSVPNAEPTAPSKDVGGGEDDKKASDGWSEISQADADRRGGRCGLAKMRYDKARKLDDAKVRARALAGLGLCEHAAGHAAEAKKLFAQARAADAGVSGFIDRELGAMDQGKSQGKGDQVDQASPFD